MMHSAAIGKNTIVQLTFQFALNIIAFSEQLVDLGKYAIAKQVIRSGTSIGANVREAQNAESKNDFIHKMKISAKEADETEYWLLLCQHSTGYPVSGDLLKDVLVLQKVLAKIISTSKKSMG